MGDVSPVAQHIRQHKQQLASEWAREVVAELRELTRLERGALIDHLPEVLDGLADWIEGRTANAERSFAALADGHAIQRLGFGVELAAVHVEYACLRRILLTSVFGALSGKDIANEVLRLDQGLDRAIYFSVERYTHRRDHVRDRFVSILGHDLRGPLGAASMATATLLRMMPHDARVGRYAQVIARANERMAAIIRDVLDFARGHLGGGIPVSPKVCDMGELCRAAADEAMSANPTRAIAVAIEGDLRGAFDRDRVLQLLGNLVGNAIQHGEDPIEISASEADDGRSVITSVANRGKPIAPELVRKMFEPFAHGGDETKGSLGLGLFIVSQIARAHGATCEVWSAAGRTVFTIHWPRTPLHAVPDRA